MSDDNPTSVSVRHEPVLWYPQPTESDQINEVVTALIQAQGSFSKLVADQENDYYSSVYVDLAGVLRTIGAALRDAGIAVVQQTTIEADGRVVLTTRLIHTSGQWLGSRYPVNPVDKSGSAKRDPQSLGSALTYARRYSLMALVGIAPEDDDGNEVSTPSRQEAPRQQSRPQDEPPGEHPKFAPYRDSMLSVDSTEALAAIGSEIASDRELPRTVSAQLKDIFDQRMKELTAAPAEGEPAADEGKAKANGRARR